MARELAFVLKSWVVAIRLIINMGKKHNEDKIKEKHKTIRMSNKRIDLKKTIYYIRSFKK